ncbi:MAG TPA: DsrE family protein [Steroidobacteraceae bacterium]|nr:DsrE family protein [Steroidobacteraceae bacterium]
MVRVLATAACLLAAAAACGADSDFWTTPTIHGYGRIHLVPHAAYAPDRAAHYKIVFALTDAARTPAEVNPSLDRVARTVNLYVASGVPLSHLKFVAIAYGAATPLALDDEHYRARFGTANPNLPLIALLRKAGVDVAVCAQAVAGYHFDYSWLDPSVTLALSGLTTVTTLEHAGYVLMPL